MPAFAAEAARNPQRKRSCILLWMNGGPATIDMWDLKPKHVNGGPYRQIEAAPGLLIGEHLPRLAKHGKHLAVVRSMSTKEGDHGRGTYYLRTGNLPQERFSFQPSVRWCRRSWAIPPPSCRTSSLSRRSGLSAGAFGRASSGRSCRSSLVKQLRPAAAERNADRSLRVRDLDRPREVSPEQAESRYDILKDMERSFISDRPTHVAQSHATAYDRAVRLMQSVGAKAFDLSEESAKVRDPTGEIFSARAVCWLADL